MATSTPKLPFDPVVFLDTENGSRTISKYQEGKVIFSQGSPADAIFYIRKGKIKLTVVSTCTIQTIVSTDSTVS